MVAQDFKDQFKYKGFEMFLLFLSILTFNFDYFCRPKYPFEFKNDKFTG